MNQTIINVTELTTNAPKFKDSKLQAHTSAIISIYTDASKFVEKKNRELAAILSQILSEKCYIADGFKSVEEYAEKTFGIKKSNAYALAKAGTLYSDEKVPAEVKALSPSKLVELSKVKPEEIAAAIKAGKIKPDSTQKELRDFAKEQTAISPKSAVVDNYTARVVNMNLSGKILEVLNQPHTIEYFHEVIAAYVQENNLSVLPVETVKLSKTVPIKHLDQKKKVIDRYLYVTENFGLVVEYYIYIPPKKKEAPKFTRDELMAMLAELDKK